MELARTAAKDLGRILLPPHQIVVVLGGALVGVRLVISSLIPIFQGSVSRCQSEGCGVFAAGASFCQRGEQEGIKNTRSSTWTGMANGWKGKVSTWSEEHNTIQLMEKAGTKKGEIVEQEGHEKEGDALEHKGNGWSVRGRTWSDMASTGNDMGKASKGEVSIKKRLDRKWK
jgi:hypothetical protein